MITFDILGVPIVVLAQVFTGPGGSGIPGPPGPGKTCARTATGTPQISKVIIFLDPYREFRTSPKRLWTPQKRRPEQLFWPAEPKTDRQARGRFRPFGAPRARTAVLADVFFGVQRRFVYLCSPLNLNISYRI